MRGHSMKMMWGCGALIAVVLVAVGAGGRVLLFVIPCMLMMGAMMWMMSGVIG
ncbi:MAG: hypothetical protein ACR2LK_09485 [Solirubrobacteraceae bacterium]